MLKIKNYVQHLNQTLTVTNNLARARDLSATGPRHPSWMGDMEGPAQNMENQITQQPTGGKWTGSRGVLLTSPAALKPAGIKPWIHHTRLSEEPGEEKWTAEPKEDFKGVLRRQ